MNREQSGLIAAIAAFCMWGVLPIYWKLLEAIPAATIVAHRTIWSLTLLTAILFWRRELPGLLRQLRSASAIGWLLLSGTLLATNWTLYVWATTHDRIIEGALGYYLNPFFNMLFGAIWFGDRHNRMQLTAIALALCGVALQIPAISGFPWVAITLAVTFSLYAVAKKCASFESRRGLTAESAMLAPIAIVWLGLTNTSPAAVFGGSWTHALLLIGGGIATTAPLLCFGHAARNLSLTTLGMIQFIGPTLQLIIGWKLYGEPMSTTRLLSFALIWAAVFVYALDARRRRSRIIL